MKEDAQNYDGTHAIESDTVPDLWFYKKISTIKSTHYFVVLRDKSRLFGINE
jgi:hypothetical protein